MIHLRGDSLKFTYHAHHSLVVDGVSFYIRGRAPRKVRMIAEIEEDD